MTIYPNITSRKDGTNLDGGPVRARGLVFFFLIFFALKLESPPPHLIEPHHACCQNMRVGSRQVIYVLPYSFLHSLFPVIQSLEYYLLAQLLFLAVMVVLPSLIKI